MCVLVVKNSHNCNCHCTIVVTFMLWGLSKDKK